MSSRRPVSNKPSVFKGYISESSSSESDREVTEEPVKQVHFPPDLATRRTPAKVSKTATRVNAKKATRFASPYEDDSRTVDTSILLQPMTVVKNENGQLKLVSVPMPQADLISDSDNEAGDTAVPTTKPDHQTVAAPISNRGERGERGERGPAGERGLKGERGEKGDRGEKGECGEKGDRGEKGDTGPAGPVGVAAPVQSAWGYATAVQQREEAELVGSGSLVLAWGSAHDIDLVFTWYNETCSAGVFRATAVAYPQSCYPEAATRILIVDMHGKQLSAGLVSSSTAGSVGLGPAFSIRNMGQIQPRATLIESSSIRIDFLALFTVRTARNTIHCRYRVHTHSVTPCPPANHSDVDAGTATIASDSVQSLSTSDTTTISDATVSVPVSDPDVCAASEDPNTCSEVQPEAADGGSVV